MRIGFRFGQKVVVASGMLIAGAGVAQATPILVTMPGTFINSTGPYYVWQPEELARPVTFTMEYDTDWVGDVAGSELQLDYLEFPVRMTLTTTHRTVVAQGPWERPTSAQFEIYGGSTYDRIEIDHLPVQGGGFFHWDFFNLANDKKLPSEFSQADFNEPGSYLVVAIDSGQAFVTFDPADVTVTVVPEPASLVLAGLGAAALLSRRRAR